MANGYGERPEIIYECKKVNYDMALLNAVNYQAIEADQVMQEAELMKQQIKETHVSPIPIGRPICESISLC